MIFKMLKRFFLLASTLVQLLIGGLASRICERSNYCSGGNIKGYIGPLDTAEQFKAALEATHFRQELIIFGETRLLDAAQALARFREAGYNHVLPVLVRSFHSVVVHASLKVVTPRRLAYRKKSRSAITSSMPSIRGQLMKGPSAVALMPSTTLGTSSLGCLIIGSWLFDTQPRLLASPIITVPAAYVQPERHNPWRCGVAISCSGKEYATRFKYLARLVGYTSWWRKWFTVGARPHAPSLPSRISYVSALASLERHAVVFV